jgi:hypothetical protein
MNMALDDATFRRSARRGVRNPVLLLPAATRLCALPAHERRLFGDLLREIARDADLRAERAWKKRKGPMAAYWRATSTYAKHIARAIDPRTR